MATITQHPHGMFCWPELSAHDWPRAKEFYCKLFGWEADDQPIGNDMYYSMLTLPDETIGAMYPMGEEQKSAQIPTHWLCYASVDNVDECMAKAARLGAKIVAPAMDVGDAGRMGIISDPQGASIGLWQANQHHGTTLLGQPSSLCWTELASRDSDASETFYCDLLGWSSAKDTNPDMPYTMFSVEGQQQAGMLQMTEEWGDVPPHWMVYFAVEDCDASVALAESLGGEICVPPTNIETVGRFAVITDPQGAVFSIIALDPNYG